MQQMPQSSRLVQVICARSAYLHTGQRPYQAALEGLIHDRTRSRGRAAQYLLARTGASIHGTCAGGRLMRVLPPSTVFHEASWREPGGAGWLLGAMTRPATPGRRDG